jgi:hypothetical protein
MDIPYLIAIMPGSGRDAINGWRFGSSLLLAIMMNTIPGLLSEKL